MPLERRTRARRRLNTAAGVESTLVWGFLGIRAFDLSQALVAFVTGSLSRSTNPALDVTLLALVAGESSALGWWLVRSRSVRPFGWPIAADFSLGMIVIGLSALYVAPEARLSVWTMWAYPVTLSSTVLAGASLARWQASLACSGAFVCAYVGVVAIPVLHDSDVRSTALANALAYPGFTMVAFLFTRFVRNLAKEADDARQRVAELERERTRAITHDLLPFLRLDRFMAADERTRALLVAQAEEKYRQMRAFIDGTDRPGDLNSQLRAVVDLHPQLAARTVFDIDCDVHLEPEVLEHLVRAVDTALANVSQNAPKAAVVVTATSTRDQIAVTVRDDGPGFDAPQVELGYGITQILGRQLANVGGSGTVTSTPGKGTQVTIVLPREAP